MQIYPIIKSEENNETENYEEEQFEENKEE